MPYPTRAACALALAGALLLPGHAAAHPDMTAFDDNIFAVEPVTVDCTLENGDAATCNQFSHVPPLHATVSGGDMVQYAPHLLLSTQGDELARSCAARDPVGDYVEHACIHVQQ